MNNPWTFASLEIDDSLCKFVHNTGRVLVVNFIIIVLEDNFYKLFCQKAITQDNNTSLLIFYNTGYSYRLNLGISKVVVL